MSILESRVECGANLWERCGRQARSAISNSRNCVTFSLRNIRSIYAVYTLYAIMHTAAFIGAVHKTCNNRTYIRPKRIVMLRTANTFYGLTDDRRQTAYNAPGPETMATG